MSELSIAAYEAETSIVSSRGNYKMNNSFEEYITQSVVQSTIDERGKATIDILDGVMDVLGIGTVDDMMETVVKQYDAEKDADAIDGEAVVVSDANAIEKDAGGKE